MWILILAIFATGCEIDFQEPDEPLTEEPMLGSNNKSKTGGWSTANVLTTKDVSKEVSLQANFPVAEYYTVKFGVTQPNPLVVSPDILADVVWTVEGNHVRRRISVGNGSSISGTGAACSVKVKDATLVGPAGSDYTVSVALSPGTRPSVEQPPILRGVFGGANPYLTVIAPGAFIDLPIPQDAGVISADVECIGVIAGVPTPLTTTDVFVAQFDAPLTATFKNYYPLIETGFVPVFPATAVLRIVNASAATSAVVSVLFGIDG